MRTIIRCAALLAVVATSMVFLGCTKSDKETSPPVSNITTYSPDIQKPVVAIDGSSADSSVSSASMVITTSQSSATFDSNGNFAKTDELSATRSGHTATLLKNGQVLIVGGSGNDGMGEDGGAGSYVSRVIAELYDPKTWGFVRTGQLISARSLHTATLLSNGLVLIVGGQKSYGEASRSAEIYDPSTGKFKATGNLNQARSSHTATLLPSGRVLIAGGMGNILENGRGWSEILASAELYDPARGKFTLIAGSLAVARSNQTATLLSSGKVLFTGGVGKELNSVLASAELYDPEREQFVTTGSLTSKRVDHVATLLQNDKVLIVGGCVGDCLHTALKSTEIYDPITGQFSKAADLVAERFGHTSTLLANGKVLIVAGSSKIAAIKSVEIYDPSTNTSTEIESLHSFPRKSHTATLLQNGRVLIVGGDDYDYAFDDAELYEPAH